MAPALTAYATQHADVAGLEEALAVLWDQIEESDRDVPLCRAVTLNLIAVTEESHADDLDAAIDALLVRHPCRAFVVSLREESDISASLEARIRTDRGARQTVLERISLAIGRNDISRLEGLILPLLINDVPVISYWAGPLPGRPEDVAAVADLAQRTIFDSARFQDPDRDRRRLAEVLGARPATDLVSFRVRPWRRALAEAFELVEWSPAAGTRIRIEHRERAAATAATASLAQSLGERLHAEVERVPVPDSGETTQPERLTLRNGETSIAVVCEGAVLRVDVTLTNHCLLPFRVPTSRGSSGDLLAAAVDV